MPPKKRRAKKPVVQQKQKQSQNVAQKVTVNLVQPKAKPRRRAIANSGYKAYQQQPQTIFLNNPPPNPPPSFPMQQSGGFTPYQQRAPLGAEIMQEPSRFTQPVPVPVPVPVPFQSDATVASNPLRNSIFEEESPLISRKPPQVTRPRPVTRDPFGIFSNDESDGNQTGEIFSDRATIGVGDVNVIPSPEPSPAQDVAQVGRRIPATTNYNRMLKPQLIELAEKYDLPVSRIGAKGKRVALTNNALKDSIRQYLDNNRSSRLF